MRKTILTTLISGALTLVSLAAAKPNIVVLLVDDLGFMDIGPTNPDCFYDTPHLDALAKESMLFTNGYATCPVCSPSRVSMLTGRYPTLSYTTHLFPGGKNKEGKSATYRPAAFTSELPLNEVTIADALKEQGYATFFAGKWHLGHGEEYLPQNRGFDVNIGGYDRGGPYSGKKYFAPYKNPQIKEEGPDGEHLPDRLARETVKFAAANKDKPFLAYLSFYSVHTPLMGRKDLVEKYKKLADPASESDFEPITTSAIRRSTEGKIRVKQNHVVYAAMVEAMDAAVGTVIQGLKDNGQWDNTILFFTSDNGGLSTSEGSPTSNRPLDGGKGWMLEGGIREPWLVRYPGKTKEGQVSEELIIGNDVFATATKAAGYEPKHIIDGVDLVPALEGGQLERKALYWHYPHYSNQGGLPGGAIREGDFKLLYNYEDGTSALYNLRDDIGETTDLSEQHPELKQELRRKLYTWLKDQNARFLRPRKDGQSTWAPDYDSVLATE